MSDHQRYTAEYKRLQGERDRYRNEAHVLTHERDAALSELDRLKHYSDLRDSILAGAITSLRGIYDLLPRYSCKSSKPDGCPVCVARQFLTEDAINA